MCIRDSIKPNTKTIELAPYFCDKEFEACAKELFELSDILVLNLSEMNGLGIRQFKIYEMLKELCESINTIRIKEAGICAALQHELLHSKKAVGQHDQEAQDSFKLVYALDSALNNHPEFISMKKIFVKIDGDLDSKTLANFIQLSKENLVEGFVVGSSASQDPDIQKQNSINTVKALRRSLGNGVPIVGSGGIRSAADVKEFMNAGANLVQVYSLLDLKSPYIVEELIEDLK
eukprot:TRINITY_DN6258_c0_g1_i4.p1 TRINITY_DN6258_c0_g1~~TRINITY_DN6258_c0_g1_i4.p1  ORF type:complete len:233 (+),score=34.74 TRINITY_DN6258_c0_g1_i4:65-763(+)